MRNELKFLKWKDFVGSIDRQREREIDSEKSARRELGVSVEFEKMHSDLSAKCFKEIRPKKRF